MPILDFGEGERMTEAGRQRYRLLDCAQYDEQQPLEGLHTRVRFLQNVHV